MEGYYRRIDETSPSAGVSARARLLGGTAGAFIEARWLSERQTSQETADAEEDTWRTNGWSGGASWQRPLGRSWHLELGGEAEQLRGEADAAFDEEAVFFTAKERRIEGRGMLRFVGGEWNTAFGAGIRHERRVRNDSSAAIGSSISATSPVVEAMAGRRLGRVTLTVSGGVLFHAPTSTIPAPSARGPKYQQLIAPELDLYAMPAQPYLWALRLDWRVSSNAVLWLTARTESISPTDLPLTASSPTGDRSATAIEGGLVIR
jgi:hypothetical protein